MKGEEIMENRSFQDVFKELRIENNLSQDKIAEELDVSPALISKWERNASTPAPEMLEYIADYFNVSIDYLVGRSKYKNLENENTEIDNVLFSKVKDLSDEDKKAVLGIINAIKKDVDKELD